MNPEIYKIVSNYHTATQGGSYDEEKEMEKLYEQAKLTYGVGEVMKVVEYYNTNVIRKAGQQSDKKGGRGIGYFGGSTTVIFGMAIA